MFGLLVFISALTVAGAWVVAGFSLYSMLMIIPLLCFTSRKLGYYVKFSSIVAFEVMFLFIHFTAMFIFGNIRWIELLLLLIIRAVSTCVVLYDDIVYVYVTEERKR